MDPIESVQVDDKELGMRAEVCVTEDGKIASRTLYLVNNEVVFEDHIPGEPEELVRLYEWAIDQPAEMRSRWRLLNRRLMHMINVHKIRGQ